MCEISKILKVPHEPSKSESISFEFCENQSETLGGDASQPKNDLLTPVTLTFDLDQKKTISKSLRSHNVTMLISC